MAMLHPIAPTKLADTYIEQCQALQGKPLDTSRKPIQGFTGDFTSSDTLALPSHERSFLYKQRASGLF